MAKAKKAVEEADTADSSVLKLIDERIAAALKQLPNSVAMVGTKSELIHALSQLLIAQDELQTMRIKIDKETHAILNAYVEQLAPLQAKVAGIEKAIEQYALSNRKALLEEFGVEGGKTVTLVTGDIVFREKPPALRKRPNVDENDAAEALLAEGHSAFVQRKYSVLKDAARVQWQALESVLSPYFTLTKGGESVLIRPIKTEV